MYSPNSLVLEYFQTARLGQCMFADDNAWLKGTLCNMGTFQVLGGAWSSI